MLAATVIVRQSRGTLIVQATGRTGKGVSFIKGTEKLTAKTLGDPDFKGELKTAIGKLLSSDS